MRICILFQQSEPKFKALVFSLGKFNLLFKDAMKIYKILVSVALLFFYHLLEVEVMEITYEKCMIE
ncbi:hypothetical protein ANHYDRO_01491 [Anaerococcus hydrogenalis DSM 7454]|uniref:Uncharacterized protein n=1 Tax=Anaerococcus hydrogenalis DSM 7454 TaxID=561177 RepID=B6WA65_9FIRM|nr:hypothetical protein ANHYDRO_01491 [Anaerococcus hydrogenalis DSM 7454]